MSKSKNNFVLKYKTNLNPLSKIPTNDHCTPHWPGIREYIIEQLTIQVALQKNDHPKTYLEARGATI